MYLDRFKAFKSDQVTLCTDIQTNTIICKSDLKKSQGERSVVRSLLRNSVACKRDMRRGGTDIDDWESVTRDRSAWRQHVIKSKHTVETKRRLRDKARRGRRHPRNQQGAKTQVSPDRLYIHQRCDLGCGSRIGL